MIEGDNEAAPQAERPLTRRAALGGFAVGFVVAGAGGVAVAVSRRRDPGAPHEASDAAVSVPPSPASSRAGDTKVVLAVGDSILAGGGLANLSDRWVVRLGDVLRASRIGTDRFTSIVTRIDGGGQTLVDDWDRLLALKVDLILVTLGLNDVAHTPLVTISDALTGLFRRAEAARVGFRMATIVPVSPQRFTQFAVVDPPRREFNNWARQAELGGDVLDFDSALRDVDGTLLPAFDSGDGFHPNPYGHLRLADAARAFLGRASLT